MKELAEVAARETLPHFRSLNTVENKSDEGYDPVTIADRNAELAIREAIINRFPEHGIKGEEFGPHNPHADICWVIDPIDGTRAFIAGLPVWGSLIGLCKSGKPVAGLMSQPFTGEIFFTDGTTSYFEHKAQKRSLRTSGEKNLENAILMSTAPELFGGKELGTFNQLTKSVQMTRYGADCYAYCMLAAGHVDLVVESGLNLYDVAALIPIIENAGGTVTDWNGNPFSDTGNIVAAATAELHNKALRILG